MKLALEYLGFCGALGAISGIFRFPKTWEYIGWAGLTIIYFAHA